MTDVSGNVEALGYGIGSATTDAITDAQYTIFKAWADARILADGVTDTTGHATALLVCHYIAVKLGDSGKTSESIGKYSYTRKLGTRTTWMDEYLDEYASNGISALSTDGLTRDDATMTSLSLDQSTPYDLADEERDE